MLYKKSVSFKMTYDSEVDAAYIYIYIYEAAPSGVDRTVTVEDDNLAESVFVDIGKNSELIGLEVLDASKILSKDILDKIKQ